MSAIALNPSAGFNGSFEFVSIDYPGATATRVFGINGRGDVVGSYVDSAGKTDEQRCRSRWHGFFDDLSLADPRFALVPGADYFGRLAQLVRARR